MLNDLLGLNPGHVPRHVKTYADLKGTVVEAIAQFRDDVREGKFPGEEHRFRKERWVRSGKSSKDANTANKKGRKCHAYITFCTF